MGDRAVRGHAGGFKDGAQGAFVSVDNLETGRFGNDGEIGAETGGHESRGTGGAEFFIAGAGKPDGDWRLAVFIENAAERHEHGGHGAFGVARAAAIEFAVANCRRKWRDDHAVDSNDVGMGVEQERALGILAWEAGEEVGAAGGGVGNCNLAAPAAQKFGEEFDHGAFAIGRLDRDAAFRADAGTGNKLRKEIGSVFHSG